MSDEIFGVNQVLLSRNYRCANPVVEKSSRNGLVGKNCLHRMCFQGLHLRKLAGCATDVTDYWLSLLMYWSCVY